MSVSLACGHMLSAHPNNVLSMLPLHSLRRLLAFTPDANKSNMQDAVLSSVLTHNQS